jgi:hypothetical protein
MAGEKRRSDKGKVSKAVTAAIPPKGYESCIVSFIDVMGFRELLDRPAGEVLKVLNLLRDFTTPRYEAPVTRMKDARLVSRAFAESVSDAVVRLRVYETQFRDGAFFLELINLLHVQIECVNAGVLIRAGVAIGPVYVGVNGEGPFFGAGLVRAYKIESEEAVFPRIVVDDAAYNAFLADEQLRSEENELGEEREYVDRLLRIGEDGTRFIDYLRAAQTEVDDQASYFQFLRH